MPRGFFAASSLAQVKPKPSLIPRCGECGLYQNCKNPKMQVSGKGGKGILVVGDAPGKEEDEQGSQFVGKSGKLLRKELARLGVDLDADCWQTNAIICRTADDGTPNSAQIDACRPNYIKAVTELQPRLILVLGAPAVSAVVGTLWHDDTGPITRWAGWAIPTHSWNAWVCPTYHPSQILRSAKDKPDPVMQLWWRRHLTDAVTLARADRPWLNGSPPDYRKKVECIYEPAAAATILDEMVRRGGPVAVDYETNMLKPDGPGARIVCCSASWQGRRTIAYPWHGPAIEATRRLLRSPMPKIASNLKFEDRWSRAILGTPVRNWAFDTMVGAHALDNRYGITSIKFQSFIRYGVQDYASHIKPYLTSKGNEETNRILTEIDKRDLYLYCGLDSLLEYMVAVDMRKELGMPPL